MTTITHSAGIITPTIVDGYQASREARTVVHPIINKSSPDVTLRAAGLRTGEMRCVFALEADALTAFDVLSTGQVFILADNDRPTIGMSFVVAEGDIGIALDGATRDVWVVTVPFVEVTV